MLRGSDVSQEFSSRHAASAAACTPYSKDGHDATSRPRRERRAQTRLRTVLRPRGFKSGRTKFKSVVNVAEARGERQFTSHHTRQLWLQRSYSNRRAHCTPPCYWRCASRALRGCVHSSSPRRRMEVQIRTERAGKGMTQPDALQRSREPTTPDTPERSAHVT